MMLQNFEAPGSSTDEKELDELCDGQQSEVIAAKILEHAKSLLMDDERIQHLVIQNHWSLKVFPSALIMTQKRLMLLNQGWFKMSFLDMHWRFLKNTHLSENFSGASIVFQTVDGKELSINCLPKALARKAYKFAQGIEEYAIAFQRHLWLEEENARNKLGSVPGFQAPRPAPPALAEPSPPVVQRVESQEEKLQKIETQMELLEELKKLRENELVSLEEYQDKRNKLLNGLLDFDDALESMRRLKILLDKMIISDFEYAEYKSEIMRKF